MHSLFALVMAAVLNTGEPANFVLSVHDTHADCMAAAAEKKYQAIAFRSKKSLAAITAKSRQGFKP